MSDAQKKQITSAVSHTISNYQLTSKSKSLRRLSNKNVQKITDVILERKQDKHLMELIKKRDYYTQKIHELLHESGEESNPRLINDEAEAEHYIRKRLLKDGVKVQQIKSLIQKHKYFQESSSKKHDQILHKYSKRMSAVGGLKKLGSMNAASDAKHESEKVAELKEFYNVLLSKQADLSSESESILRNLDVPFFCSLSEKNLVSSAQKKFVLDLLYKTLGEEL